MTEEEKEVTTEEAEQEEVITDTEEEQQSVETDEKESDGEQGNHVDEGIELEDTKEYTKAQMEAIAKRREKRIALKKDKEYSEKLQRLERLENLIKKGTNIEDSDKLMESLTNTFREKGIKVEDTPRETKPTYNQEEESYLAEKDFKETQELGEEEMDSEAKRLYQVGFNNMTTREKVYYGKLCQALVDNKDLKELKKKGVKPEIVESKEFKDLRSKFKGSATEFYETIYKPLYVKEEKPDNAGSQKSNAIQDDKNSYNESEANKLLSKMTPQELAENPKLLEKLKNSMANW